MILWLHGSVPEAGYTRSGEKKRIKKKHTARCSAWLTVVLFRTICEISFLLLLSCCSCKPSSLYFRDTAHLRSIKILCILNSYFIYCFVLRIRNLSSVRALTRRLPCWHRPISTENHQTRFPAAGCADRPLCSAGWMEWVNENIKIKKKTAGIFTEGSLHHNRRAPFSLMWNTEWGFVIDLLTRAL